MTRHALTAVFAIATLAATATPPAAAHARHPKPVCPPSHAKLVAANTQAALYEAALDTKYPEYLYVFGCVRGGTRRYNLGEVPECGLFETNCGGLSECADGPGCGGLRHEVLAGTMAAYESFRTGRESGHWYVVVRNLRNGRLVRRVPTGTRLVQNPAFSGVGTVVSIALKPDGSVAWLAEDFDRSRPEGSLGPEIAYYDVYAAEGATTRLLASGTDIDPSSLALAGSTLYWTQAGKPASTQLR